MEYKGRSIGFRRTVGAVADLAKLAPGGKLERLNEIMNEENVGASVEGSAQILAILNKWYEISLSMEDPGYTADPIPVEWFLCLDADDFTELSNEAMKRFQEDDKPTVETTEIKSKKN